MGRPIREVAIAVALIAGAGAASAQTTIITREPVPPQTTIIETPRTAVGPIELTPAQRSTVYRTIVRERVAGPAVTTEMRVGARVPETVTLQPVPEAVIAEVPAVRSYRYMVVNNRVLLVDPTSSTVVAEIVE